MRIGLFSPTLSGAGHANGIGTYVSIMREALLSGGHDVTVFNADEFWLADGKRGEVPIASRFDALAARVRGRVARTVGDGDQGWRVRHATAFLTKTNGFDVVEMEESFGWSRNASRAGIPVVVRLHGPHFVGREPIETADQRVTSDRRCRVEDLGISTAPGVTSPSQRLLDATRARIPVRGLTRTIFNPQPLPSVRWKVEQSDPNQILCVGRFDLRKGADIVLRAFTEAMICNPSLRLAMVGPDNGIRGSDGCIRKFRQYVAEEVPANVAGRISHLGVLSPAQINELRLQSACIVVGSRFETFSYVLAESMALGMPVITANLFGAGELVENNRTGLVVVSEDSAAIKDAILALTADRSKAAALGRRARQWCESNLDPAGIASLTTEFYQLVLGQAR